MIVGRHIHQKTQKKLLIDFVCDSNLCISYDKILRIESMSIDSVASESENHNGLYIPPITNCQEKILLAIDNPDFHNHTT